MEEEAGKERDKLCTLRQLAALRDHGIELTRLGLPLKNLIHGENGAITILKGSTKKSFLMELEGKQRSECNRETTMDTNTTIYAVKDVEQALSLTILTPFLPRVSQLLC
ncbi:hypothetical protein CYMTET_45415 [Cymbomonas tetramitiformis]|uniref:Uncharacterized protein n=1 Tax=Cymbomonas tetramitiformis TaxID=36881 RepID=A0AAE0BZD4_9CHLO|nr:hypothetical protein CYMTET_45415 [Cymbomonas tetramitiformis]